MAKKTETKKTEAKKAVRATKKPSLDIAFGAWLKTARARKDKNVEGVPELMAELKADKKIKDDAKLVNVAKRFEGNPAFAVIASRYQGFARRGSQAKAAA